MRNFTPGPWELDRKFNGLVVNGHPHAAWEVVSPSEETGVCVCILPYEDITNATKTMCAANAALIAAAPDMHEALTNARAVIESLDVYNRYGPVRDQMRAALAKADGKPTEETV